MNGKIERAVQHAVDIITGKTVEMGVDVSPSDVGFIVASFLEIMLVGGEYDARFSSTMQRIADAANAVKDE